jgi:citronellol/citronellal dehydrogenase
VNLDGKVAIVTGASRGVGAATAVALADAGALVACAARATDENPLRLPGTIDTTVQHIAEAGGDALAVPTNLAIEDEVERMVATTVEHFGRLDILVNNAAITFPGDIDVPMKRYDLMLAVNLRAPLVAARAVVPHMKRQGEGAILNISSAAALSYIPGLMVYGMSKIALEHLTVSLATQLAPHQIAVNTFRIDVPVASEGFVANTPGFDHSSWEPTEVPAEGIVWVLRQPSSYTGHNVSMQALRDEHGIMARR